MFNRTMDDEVGLVNFSWPVKTVKPQLACVPMQWPRCNGLDSNGVGEARMSPTIPAMFYLHWVSKSFICYKISQIKYHLYHLKFMLPLSQI